MDLGQWTCACLLLYLQLLHSNIVSTFQMFITQLPAAEAATLRHGAVGLTRTAVGSDHPERKASPLP